MDLLELDVFCTGPFTGNPLAVVADADGLGGEQMQRIAHWTNFSETTFLLRPTTPDADYRVRIFTPREEFGFAGHPTLGSARAFLALGGRPRTPGVLVQECGVGLVPVRVEGDRLAFATPPRQRTGPLEDAEVDALADLLGLQRDAIVAHAWGVNGPRWRLLQLRDADAVRAVRPRRPAGDLKCGVVGLEPEGAEVAYEVRAFSDTVEDPVTGSLNGAMAQWLREHGLVPDTYEVAQGGQVGRRGRVSVRDDGSDIWIGGRVDVRVRGSLDVADTPAA